MNEQLLNHVRRLYEESAGQCFKGTAWEWELKFAEVIIRECAEIALREDHEPSECILKHFGLK